MRREGHITSYSSLKEALLSEFAQSLSPAQIHQLLATRNCRPNKKLFEFCLQIKEMAQSGNVDDLTLIYYIINGINITLNNKAILYSYLYTYPILSKSSYYMGNYVNPLQNSNLGRHVPL